MKQRVIALVDCDSFFVSCERIDNPALQNKPVCVMTGGSDKGIIVSRSKEAKKIGIKMGAPYFQVKHTYPQAIYIPAHHDRYVEISKQVMNTLKEFSPDVEISSIDEAYIDLTGLNKVYKSTYTDIIKKIRQTILEKAKIPVSIGLCTSKTLAKLASDKAKKNGGIFVIHPDKILEKVGDDDITDVCGIGHKNAEHLQYNGILTIKDFVSQDNNWIKKAFGITGFNLKLELQGIATSQVDANPSAPQQIQDFSAFEDFTDNYEILYSSLNYHIHKASRKLRKWNGFCQSIGVILRTKDFRFVSIDQKLEVPTNSEMDLLKTAQMLLNKLYKSKIMYRGSGIYLNNLTYGEEKQLSLFEQIKRKDDKLSHLIDELEDKFGKNVIHTGFKS